MSKEQAIAKLVPAFRQYGYEGATLSLLSKASGLGKASLYHHFPGGKTEMAATVFEYVNSCFRDRVLKTLQGEDDSKSKIRAMCSSLQEFYDRGQKPCFLAIMSFGEADNLFHDRVKASLKQIIEALAKVLIDAGIEPKIAETRSQDAIAKIQGALILVRILNDTESFERAIESLSENLLA